MFEAMFNGWLRGYEWTLDKVLRYKFIILLVTLGDAGRHGLALHRHPEGLLPDRGHRLHLRDRRRAVGHLVQGDVGSPARDRRDRPRADPAVDYVNSTVGAGGPNPTNNYGRLFIALKPKKERGENVTEVIQRLRRSANTVTGMVTYFQAVQNINITGRISKSEFQYTLQSSDTEALYRVAPEMRDKIAKIEGLRDVTTDLYIKNPQMTIEIDREEAAVYGISVDQIRQELFNAFGNRQVATIYTPIERLPDHPGDAGPNSRPTPAGLSKIYRQDQPRTAARRGVAGGSAAASTATASRRARRSRSAP